MTEKGKYTRRSAHYTSLPEIWAQKVASANTFKEAFRLATTEPLIHSSMFESCTEEMLQEHLDEVSVAHHALVQLASTFKECMLSWRIAANPDMCQESLEKAIMLAKSEVERSRARSMMQPEVRALAHQNSYSQYILGGGGAMWDS